MSHSIRRRNRVTTSFIRNVRKGHLDEAGIPLPGEELRADTLLRALSYVQDGVYPTAMRYAKERGIDLEQMYDDYHALIRESRAGRRTFGQGLREFCTKHQTKIRVRTWE